MEINKTLARRRFQKQLRIGIVKRPSKCSNCGSSEIIQAHHHDYTKPFSVVWLCFKCHRSYHSGNIEKLPEPCDYSKIARDYSPEAIKKAGGDQSAIVIDRETHHQLKILAAVKSVSIKQVLKELVEAAKKQETQDV